LKRQTIIDNQYSSKDKAGESEFGPNHTVIQYELGRPDRPGQT